MKFVFLILVFLVPLAVINYPNFNLVYSYNRSHIDSLEIIVNKNGNTVYKKNHKLVNTDIDSVSIPHNFSKYDTIQIVMRGYKEDLWCFPFIDEMVLVDHFRRSYGINFECVKLKT